MKDGRIRLARTSLPLFYHFPLLSAELLFGRVYAGNADLEAATAVTAYDFRNNRIGQNLTNIDVVTGKVTGPFKVIIDFKKVVYR